MRSSVVNNPLGKVYEVLGMRLVTPALHLPKTANFQTLTKKAPSWRLYHNISLKYGHGPTLAEVSPPQTTFISLENDDHDRKCIAASLKRTAPFRSRQTSIFWRFNMMKHTGAIPRIVKTISLSPCHLQALRYPPQ